MTSTQPGSEGEHGLQEVYGTFRRAAAFYDKQMLDRLNPLMREYLARQEMVFVSTSDAGGECDSSFRAGPPGFVRVLDDRTVMYPEYRGNGVMASLGNISENPHVGLLFVDFFHSGVGLHINGRARVIEHAAVEAFAPLLRRFFGIDELSDLVAGKRKTAERWVLVDIVEAYIHCSKHIPILAQLPGSAGHASPSGDHFRAKDEPRPWTEPQPVAAAPACPVDAAETLADAHRPLGPPARVAVTEPYLRVTELRDEDHPAPAPAPAPAPGPDRDRVGHTPPVAASPFDDELSYLLPPVWQPA